MKRLRIVAGADPREWGIWVSSSLLLRPRHNPPAIRHAFWPATASCLRPRSLIPRKENSTPGEYWMTTATVQRARETSWPRQSTRRTAQTSSYGSRVSGTQTTGEGRCALGHGDSGPSISASPTIRSCQTDLASPWSVGSGHSPLTSYARRAPTLRCCCGGERLRRPAAPPILHHSWLFLASDVARAARDRVVRQ